MSRQLVILMPAQLVGALGSIVLVTLAGIVGQRFAASPAWATLPLSLMIVATAATTVPAALIMAKIGRRLGFALSALVGAGGIGVVALSLYQESFVLLCVGTALYGTHGAFVQQFRFAAAESVPADRAGRAISLVLLASIGGAIAGPVLVGTGRDLVGQTPYIGTMILLSGLLIVSSFLLSNLRNALPTATGNEAGAGRPLTRIARQPTYMLAVLCAAVGYGVMTFVMTATPLSMHVHDGYSIEETASVVRNHVIAMYAPSLFSGVLMERFGVRRIMQVGALLLLATVAVGLAGHELLHYQLALIALGVGWNFLYVGGTTLLTRTYAQSERFRAQALNDLCVFSAAAIASLLSGQVMGWLGWSAVLIGALVPLTAVVMALALLRKDPIPSAKNAA